MNDPHLSHLVEQAFAYRGHVTVQRRDGSLLVGFIYDRGPSYVEMFDELAANRLRVPIEDIANITLSGEDCAATAQARWERRRDVLDSPRTSVWGEWGEATSLILVALPLELRSVASALGAPIRGDSARGTAGGVRWLARATGVGGGAAHVIAAERPRLVIGCGFAGALDASLGPGDLVLATSVREEGGEAMATRDDVLAIARRALATCGPLAEGEVLCASRIAASCDDKRALARPGRHAIDLESWAVARAAERANVPWLVVRAVVDPLDVELPAFAAEPRARYLGAALGYALAGPRRVRDLVRLGVHARTALRSLGRAMQALAPELGRLGSAQERA